MDGTVRSRTAFQAFHQTLFKSIAAVGEDYFRITRHEAPRCMRERVYCYELYHQLRCRTANSGYTLHAEIDKRGQYVDAPNPDLIVHRPGTADNWMVLEVKCSSKSRTLRLDDARSDINKLKRFTESDPFYQQGLFLIAGPHLSASMQAPSRWQSMLGLNTRVSVLWHQEVGREPVWLYRPASPK